MKKEEDRVNISSWVWAGIVFLIGLNVLGVGVEYQKEFQVTWLLLSAIAFQLTLKRNK